MKTADPMAVCHIVSGGAWAGAEVQAATLLRALSARGELALYAILFREGRLAEELRRCGVSVHISDDSRRSFPSLVKDCARFLKGKRISVLHSHSYKENLLASSLAFLCGVPKVIRSEHGIPEPYSPMSNPLHWCVLAADRWVARYTDARLIAVSSDMGAYWSQIAPSRRVAILRNAVDLERVGSAFGATEAKRRLGLNANGPVVGIVARLEPIKRHDLFVATAKRILMRQPECQFVIAGSGSRREAIESLIQQSGLAGCFTVLGDRSDVYDVLRGLDVLLICSDHEGIPMAVLEAMALETAVVSRRVGGIVEVIQHGSTGMLVNSDQPEQLGSACEALLLDEGLRRRLARRAREYIVRHHSSEAHAAAMTAIYLAQDGVRRDDAGALRGKEYAKAS